MLVAFITVSLCKETLVLDRAITSIATETATKQVHSSKQLHAERDGVCGTFNNLKVAYRGQNHTLHSSAECVGESFSSDSWMYRSCMYRNLCFNVESNEFVLFQSPASKLMESSRAPDTDFIASSLNTTVSIGGFVSSWGDGKFRLEWSPKIMNPNELAPSGYYELMEDTVMIPFLAMGANNVGHLLWDSLLPIYSLVSIFGLSESKLLVLRYILTGRPLPYTCEDKFAEKCKENFEKLLPLIGVSSTEFSSTLDPVLDLIHEAKSKYVCSSHGAAGIGYLTDHGIMAHGKFVSDYRGTHNYGRGPIILGFRNFMLRNMGLELPSRVSAVFPIRITFSLHSSGRDHRNLDFASQISALGALSDPRIIVGSHQFSELSMEEEIEIVAQSSILITACGGGAVSSMFLPRGASLIMYYADKKEGVANAKLDFDFLNNMGYVRTHWLSTKNMNKQTSLESFIRLVLHEIEVILL
jgi:hypothetical protein